MKRVVHIFGASGSGTSTLGRYLCGQAGYFHVDTDDYFWEKTDPPYTTKRNSADRIALMMRDIEAHDHVVISGSLTGWGDVLIPLFTLAIRLETETSVRIGRLKAREKAHFGSRIAVGGDMYENHMNFLAWAASYDDGSIDMRSKAHHDKWQKQLKCELFVLDGSLPLSRNYEIIKHAL